MKFSENELLWKDWASSFLGCGEEGNHVLEFQVNVSQVFKVLSSDFIQIGLQIFHPFFLAYTKYTVLHMHQPLRDRPFKMAFGSSEKPHVYSLKVNQ